MSHYRSCCGPRQSNIATPVHSCTRFQTRRNTASAFLFTTALFIPLFGAAGSAVATKYGAIAIDDNIGGAAGNGDYAVGTGPTKQEAQRIAMSNCTLGGNVACTLKLTYTRCGAYASSHRTAGVGTGASLEAATSAALTSCKDKACQLVVADCVDAPLRPPK